MGDSIPSSVTFYLDKLNLSLQVMRMEWTSFVNSGYMVTIELNDQNHMTLKKLVEGDGENPTLKFLKDARRKPLPVYFSFDKAGGASTNPDKKKSKGHLAYVTDMQGHGFGQDARLIIKAIDPPSFRLNAGVASAKVYKGKLGGEEGVIAQVVKEYAPDITAKVSKTNDNKSNKFAMMRMDPKTFIGSLLDWSASTSDDRSRWIVSSKDTVINIKKESDLEGQHLGIYSVALAKSPGPRDVEWWNVNLNNILSSYQTEITTGGISATSGIYIDATIDSAVVKDENTENKRNVKEGPDRAFAKPGSSENWPLGVPRTFVMSVPEHNAGDVGIDYKDYIDGRARQTFMSMLNMVMRINVEIIGEENANSSELLGVSTCTLTWEDVSGESNKNYFLSGNWIVYGFNHYYTKSTGRWTTKLYLYRIDYDAKAKYLKTPSS